MKKIIGLVFLFGNLELHSQTNASAKNSFLDSTGFGLPAGKSVSNQVGATGGRITSDDGRIELIFPAGALTSNTNISIQPVTNLFDSAAGKAYKFEPSGIQFKKPVDIIFHYSDEEDKTCPADLMGFAMQDDKGKWTQLEYKSWDSTKKILKGQIHHFSYFTNLYQIELKAQYSVRVNDSAVIQVVNRGVTIDTGALRGQNAAAALNAASKREWFANGVAGGNTFEGWVRDDLVFPLLETVFLTGVYHAPWFFPKKNPVTIGLSIRYWSKKRNAWAWKTCQTRITVFDVYRVKVVHEATGREDMEAKILDSASFTAVILPLLAGRHVYLENIKNYPPVVLKHGKKAGFKEIITVDGAEGSVFVPEKPSMDSLSNDYPPEVYFEFPLTEVFLHTAQMKVSNVTAEATPVYGYALPLEVNFIANGLPQVYSITTPGFLRKYETYKLYVSQIEK